MELSKIPGRYRRKVRLKNVRLKECGGGYYENCYNEKPGGPKFECLE